MHEILKILNKTLKFEAGTVEDFSKWMIYKRKERGKDYKCQLQMRVTTWVK